MNLLFALVFHFCISLISCRNVKYIELDPKKDIFEEKSSPTETDNKKTFSNQLRFLKVLPMNEEWKNTIEEHTAESKTKNKKALPFAIIVATPESNLDLFKNSELKPTTPEALRIVGEGPNDISKIQFEEDESDLESKIHNDEKSGVTLKSIEEQIGEVLFGKNTTSNTGEDDQLETNELKLKKSEIEEEIKVENQLDNEKDNDAESRELLTDISKAKVENEEGLHHKEDKTEFKHARLASLNPELCEHGKQMDSSREPNINKNHKSYKISLVLNKYVFVK